MSHSDIGAPWTVTFPYSYMESWHNHSSPQVIDNSGDLFLPSPR